MMHGDHDFESADFGASHAGKLRTMVKRIAVSSNVVDVPGEDPKGDVVSYAYTWSRDGVTMTDESTVPASINA